MEVKLLRLFGCDLNPLEGFEEGSRNGDQPVAVPCQMENDAEPNSSEHEPRHKMYECEFCFKKFKNSQALGGHQNAHKKERLKKRRLQLQEKTQNHSLHHTHLPYSGYFSPFVPHFKLCQDSMISFNSLHSHNRNDNSNACYAITGPRFSTCEEFKMPSVIKPSPYVPNDGQNLYIQLGFAAEIGREDRRGATRHI